MTWTHGQVCTDGRTLTSSSTILASSGVMMRRSDRGLPGRYEGMCTSSTFLPSLSAFSATETSTNIHFIQIICSQVKNRCGCCRRRCCSRVFERQHFSKRNKGTVAVSKSSLEYVVMVVKEFSAPPPARAPGLEIAYLANSAWHTSIVVTDGL